MSGDKTHHEKTYYFSAQSAQLLKDLKTRTSQDAGMPISSSAFFKRKSEPFSKKMEEARALKIKNDNTEKDQDLKEKTLNRLFVFLGFETLIIFALAFFEGFKFLDFHLDEWSLRLVITATLAQIATMLTIAVRHLFPQKENK